MRIVSNSTTKNDILLLIEKVVVCTITEREKVYKSGKKLCSVTGKGVCYVHEKKKRRLSYIHVFRERRL